MASETGNPTPQFLNAPGDVYQPTDGPAVTRYPLIYTPHSATQINYPRLPAPHELRGMDLAYREQLFTDEQIQQRVVRWALALALFGSVGILTIILLGPIIPPGMVYGAGALTAISVTGISLASGRGLPQKTLLYGIYAPLLTAFLIPAVGLFAREREVGTIAFGLLAFALFASFGKIPLEFYQDWLLAHPRLRPETRENTQKENLSFDESVGLLGVLGAAVFFGPTRWHTVTLGVLLAVALGVAADRKVMRTAYRVLGVFLTYGERSTSAPGVWRPVQSLGRRRWIILGLTLPFYLLLATGLTFFVPIDFLKQHFPSPLKGWDYLTAALQPGGPSVFLYVPPGAILYSLVVPNLLFIGLYSSALKKLDALRVRIEGETTEHGAVSGGLDDDGRTEWQWYADRLSSSPHRATDPLDPYGERVREADHLFLGVEPNFKFPVLLDRRILSEHCYIAGETGSGKTALGIMPLALQLLRGSKPRDTRTSSPQPAIVVLDLKGDPALFHTFREECGDRIPFRFFTPQPGRPTHYFNAFRELRSENRSLIQLAQLILDSLSLSHGEGYGRSYYSRQSRFALLSVLKKNPNLKSFGDLYAALDAEKKNRREAFELVSTIHALTFYPQLITSPGADTPPEHVIHMPTVIEEGQVAYFWLPAALESASVREIGKLALYALLTAAIDRQHEGKPKRQVYVVIDEFQRLAGDNFRIILEQARSFGLSAILANQTQGDLVSADTDLRPTIRTNTRLKLFFTLTDPSDVKTLIESSGEEIAAMRSFTESGNNASVAWTETLKPRLTRNDVLAASDHPLQFIAHVSRGSGYTQFGGLPIPVLTSYPISAALYRARGARPWPELTPGLAVSETSVEDIEQRRSEEAEAALAEQKAKLEELLKRKAPPQ